jgi:outer membrane protein OmpA-like peptidoglycan-associated protein
MRFPITVLLLVPFVAHAQTAKVSDLKLTVKDLVYKVDDMGGKVQSLDVKESAVEVRIDIAADVLFDFDKAEILPKAQQTLAQAAQIIRDRAKGVARIEGYTDAKGSDTYNQKLSEQRALSVKAWFVNKEHLRDSQFATQGFGPRNPVAPNKKPDGSDDPEGRQKNRRVEIVFHK